jgi:hypothetical protein
MVAAAVAPPRVWGEAAAVVVVVWQAHHMYSERAPPAHAPAALSPPPHTHTRPAGADVLMPAVGLAKALLAAAAACWALGARAEATAAAAAAGARQRQLRGSGGGVGAEARPAARVAAVADSLLLVARCGWPRAACSKQLQCLLMFNEVAMREDERPGLRVASSFIHQ